MDEYVAHWTRQECVGALANIDGPHVIRMPETRICGKAAHLIELTPKAIGKCES